MAEETTNTTSTPPITNAGGAQNTSNQTGTTPFIARHPRPAGGPGGPRPAGGPGGPGGPGGGPGGRKFFRRKKVCKIVPRRLTGVCTRHQRRLSLAIKQSRNIALLAFAARF
jgi:small subunit ribosomal protein S18